VGPEARVGICLERSPEMVLAVLGVLKAGAGYVPIDPEYPAERRQFLIEDSACAVLLTSRKLAGSFSSLSTRSVAMDESEEWLAVESADNLPERPLPGSLAYVIYTSGSTGRPKGAGVSHANFANLLDWFIREFEFAASDRVLLISSFSFDLTQKNLFAPLMTGGRICLAPAGYFDIDEICDRVQARGITSINCTPSAFYPLVDEFNRRQYPKLTSLRRVFLGGEPILTPRLRAWLRSPDCHAEIVNTYGPTECADICAYYRLTDADRESDAAPPIGKPIPNARLAIVDRRLQLLPAGVPGELSVDGGGVGRGYLLKPALTGERFVPTIFPGHPGQRMYLTGDLARYRADGNIEYLGRIDQQVKIRGHRIELPEIEAALQTHPAVSGAVVAALERSNERKLVAYIVPDGGRASTVRELARLEQSGVPETRRHTVLPDSTFVFHMNDRETEFLYREIFEERSYFRHGIAIGEGACVFDVGANIGLFALFASRQAARVTVYGFEPIPPIFEALEHNMRLHSVDAKLFRCGISNEDGQAEFAYYPNVSILSGRHADPGKVRDTVRVYLENEDRGSLANAEMEELLEYRLKTESFTCPLKTISQAIRENGVDRIDLLKIDVENGEWQVLEGIDDCHWPIIRQVVMEVHDVEDRLDLIATKLRAAGFDVTAETEDRLRRTGLYALWATRPGAAQQRTGSEPDAVWRSPEVLIQDIRSYVGRQLPEYMVPGEYIFLDALPVSPNGKVDRRALPDPEKRKSEPGPGHVEPRNRIEALLVKIWREVLHVDRIGVFDDFFALGGHSLLGTQAVSRIRSALKIELPLRVLFESKTVAGVAAAAAQEVEQRASEIACTGPCISRRGAASPGLKLESLSDEEVFSMLERMLDGSEAAE
jgi:amino acid adenylation domain-containing protein/FkbM family methyltransferase